MSAISYGVAMFVTDRGVGPGELARMAEERGFESLFVPEHTHIPASRESQLHDEPLPEHYWHTLDPFVSLTAAACATSRLRLGTGICLLMQRDPIETAKAVASLDLVSGGRVEFGVGAGWNREEMRNHGTDPRRRFSLLRERVEAMRAIWTQDEASYAGEHVAFERIWAWPKPVQRPWPAVLIGGNGAKVLDRVLAYGDEWLPEPRPGLEDRIAELQRRAGELGRPPVPVTIFGARPHQAEVERWARTGAHRCVFWLPAGATAEVVERTLDEFAEAIDFTM